eukprot:CAMPEP_0184713984 /NCGR_PEP_ID=MMETSP0314-20130426/4229_1 /TAXON_ID=38298 /ORGANISM="Rhodella maculata, Strain CCMP 736" /LENGTH=185 /DNA_ID=CAMNT_0027176775 /DNA_START=28 /DNA_END=585 /DNA_ORIENTATION=+
MASLLRAAARASCASSLSLPGLRVFSSHLSSSAVTTEASATTPAPSVPTSTVPSTSFSWTPPESLRYPLPYHPLGTRSPLPTSPPLNSHPFGAGIPAADAEDTLGATPFYVSRSSKAGMMPVYSDLRKDGRRMTIVRRIRGDMKAMAEELTKVCEGTDVKIRQGSIEVKGDYRRQIIYWLKALGF